MIELTMSYAAAYEAAQWINRRTLRNNDPLGTVYNVWEDAKSDTIGAIRYAVAQGGTVAEIDERLYAAVAALPNRTLDGADVFGWAEEALERVAAGEDLDELCDHWARPAICAGDGPASPAPIARRSLRGRFPSRP